MEGEKTGPNPTDGGKAGVKRSLLTEGHGVPIGVAMDGANRHDMKLVRETIESMVVERLEPTEERPQGTCLDKGYDYEEVRAILREFGFTVHIRSRGEEAKKIAREAGKRARRWVVERSHTWLNRFRRLLIRWKKKPEHYLAFLHFACAFDRPPCRRVIRIGSSQETVPITSISAILVKVRSLHAALGECGAPLTKAKLGISNDDLTFLCGKLTTYPGCLVIVAVWSL